MAGQALVLCEHRPDPQGGWELTARFLQADPATLLDQLERAGVAGRAHPDELIRTPIEWATKPVQSERNEWEQNGFRTWSRQGR